jgi:glucose/arabinose dehydrogenase
MELPSWCRAALVAGVVLAAATCGGGSSTPPPSTSDPAGTGERISGNERIGWNQPAADSAELATFRYAAYVDGNRGELAGVSCGGSTGAFTCSSRLPTMGSGAHSIELVSFVVDNGTVIESPKSAALRVTVAGSTAGAPLPTPGAASPTTLLTTADNLELRLDLVSDQFSLPTALAIAPDGRVFVAERAGGVRILRNGTLDPEPALIEDEVQMTSASEGGLLSIALDAQFERTHFVFAVYTVSAPDGPDGTVRFRLVRYREVDGRLGERAVLLDRISVASRPSALLGVGPDGRLYAAFDAGAIKGRTAALASYSGKVLRLNTDGTTPPDQPAGIPVFASAFQSPRGLDWHPETGALWVVDAKARNVEELRIVVAAGDAGESPRTRLPLPAGTGAAALAFYRGTLLPAFAGDLFVAAEEGRHLLRLRFDKGDPTRLVSSERLLEDAASPIRAVSVSAEGVVYVATDRTVLRLGPR